MSTQTIDLRMFQKELQQAGLWDEQHIVAWERQVAEHSFSPSVLGLGEIRVMGRSGDSRFVFPQITSLSVLEDATTLTEAERYVLDITRTIVESSPTRHRRAMSVVPGIDGAAPVPTPMLTFQPSAEHIVIVSMVRGG